MGFETKIAIVQNVTVNDHRIIHTDGIARELVKMGHNVCVVIQKSDENPQFIDYEYDLVTLPGSTYSIFGQVKFMFFLLIHLINNEYDIIHSKNPFSSIIPALLYKKKSKTIYDIRGLWIEFGVHSGQLPSILAPLLWKIEIWCIKRADKIIAISHELKKELLKKNLEKISIDVIISDGVAFKEIQNLEPFDIKNYLQIDGQVVGYVGSIDRSRKSEKILEAFKYVHEIIDSVNLVMVGPIAEKDYFYNLVEKLGLDGHVFFTGFIPHKKALRIMKSFDVAISYHEGNLSIYNVAVPTKILEYCSTGCSIVVTDHMMYKTILVHMRDCLMTNQNVVSFSNGIISILNDPILSKKISKSSIKTGKKFSFPKLTNHILNVYNT